MWTRRQTEPLQLSPLCRLQWCLKLFNFGKTLSTTRHRLICQRILRSASALFRIIILGLDGHRRKIFLFFLACMPRAVRHTKAALRIQVSYTVLFRTPLPHRTISNRICVTDLWRVAMESSIRFTSLGSRSSLPVRARKSWSVDSRPERVLASWFLSTVSSLRSRNSARRSLSRSSLKRRTSLHSRIRFRLSACTARSAVCRSFRALVIFLDRSSFSSFIAKSPHLLPNLPSQLLVRMMPPGETQNFVRDLTLIFRYVSASVTLCHRKPRF